MTYGHLQADCLYTGISSGPNARCRVWEAFTFTFLPIWRAALLTNVLPATLVVQVEQAIRYVCVCVRTIHIEPNNPLTLIIWQAGSSRHYLVMFEVEDHMMKSVPFCTLSCIGLRMHAAYYVVDTNSIFGNNSGKP